MIRDEHIEAAVAQGILTADQAVRLRDLARGSVVRDEPSADPDDEKFRLIGGFNDVFVTIGVGLLVAALFALASALGFNIGFAALGLIAAWGLAEFFSRRMRLALPSIALALMFAGAAAYLAILLGAPLLSPSDGSPEGVAGLWTAFAGFGAAIAALVHERRFRVPIDIAIAASAIVCTLSGLLGTIAPAWTSENWSLLMGLFGLGVFALAIRFDASDPARQTRRADIAFWLHLLAAPMIVHAVIPLVTGRVGDMGTPQAVGILVLFAVLGLVAIVIDRRALLVSGLTYAGIAIGYLLSQGIEEGLGLSLTLLVLAALVLGLSAGWKSLRRALLPLLPLDAIRHSIPPA
jgi:hypothetical protein